MTMNSRRISVLDAYKDYPIKDKSNPLFLTKKEFNIIIQGFGEELAHDLITSGKPVKLPSKLGTLQMVKYAVNKKLIDYKTTRELYGENNKLYADKRKVVYHTNRITRGTMPKLYWAKGSANFKNKTKYSFKLTRPNIRANSYNKNNPRVNLMTFFREQGFRTYDFFNPNNKSEIK